MFIFFQVQVCSSIHSSLVSTKKKKKIENIHKQLYTHECLKDEHFSITK